MLSAVYTSTWERVHGGLSQALFRCAQQPNKRQRTPVEAEKTWDGYQKRLFHCGGDWSLAKVPRRSVESLSLEILRSFQDMVFSNLFQMSLLDQEVWATWPLEVCFNFHHSVILWPLISHSSASIPALVYRKQKQPETLLQDYMHVISKKKKLLLLILTIYTWEKLCFNIGNISERWSLIYTLILSVEFSLAFCSSWTVNIACIFTLLFWTVPTRHILI